MSFVYKTPIISNCQPKYIGDVEPNDWVLTYKLQYPEESKVSLAQQTYIDTIGIHEQEPVFMASTFWASDVFQVNDDIVTPDHRFLVRRSNQSSYRWVQAQELDPKRNILFRIHNQRHVPIEKFRRLNKRMQVTKLIIHEGQAYIAGKGSYLSL